MIYLLWFSHMKKGEAANLHFWTSSATNWRTNADLPSVRLNFWFSPLWEEEWEDNYLQDAHLIFEWKGIFKTWLLSLTNHFKG